LKEKKKADVLLLEWYDGNEWIGFNFDLNGPAVRVIKALIEAEAFSQESSIHQENLLGRGRRLKDTADVSQLLGRVIITTSKGKNVKGKYWLKSNTPPGYRGS
jgi:hypothetical protein